MTRNRTGDVVCFLDRDHVLDLAMHLLRGPSPESRRALSDFLDPETVDVAALMLEPPLDQARLVGPPPCYGEIATPPPDTSVLVVRRSAVTAELMETMPQLRHVQKLGERSDRVDLAWATAHGISVELVARPSLESTADHVVMLMLALVRNLLDGDRRARRLTADGADDAPAVSYNWTGMRNVRALRGSTVGLVGLGEVGTRVASRVRAFGADVVYTSRTRLAHDLEHALGVRWLTQSELLACSDIVSLHVPGTSENRDIVDKEFLGRMKPGSCLVNVARGSLVDEAALVSALERRWLSGAALDVHAHEPRRRDDPLIAREDVILTPHIAGGTRSDALPEILAVARGVRRALEADPVTGER